MASVERLPWLADEPRKAERDGVPRRTGPRGMWPWYLLLLLLVVGVGAGAWWLGTRQQDAAAPELPAEESTPIAPAPPAQPEATPAPEPAPAPPEATPAPRVEAEPRVSRRAAETRTAPATGSPARPRSVFPADEPVSAPPPVTGPTPVIVYHPNPNRGRVVQLGAFPTRAQAEESWRRITRRYPYLLSKPKMVNTVDVRALGGGRPTRMYRLQLGTSSQAQSVVICQQLERAGQSCVVVY